MPSRLLYDIECDKLIKAQKIQTRYNNKGTQHEYKCNEINKKRKISIENATYMSNESRSILLCNLNGY